jgi:hypothetical protein
MFIVNNVFNYFSNYFIAGFGDCPLPRLSGRQKANPVLSDLEKLPNDLLLTIFTKLNAEERENLSQTSTFLANKSISPIVLASLFERELVPPHKSLEFAKMAGIFLTKFHPINSKVTDQELKEIFKVCPNIQQLNLSGCTRLTDAAIGKLPKGLLSLNVHRCRLTGATMNELPQGLLSLNVSRATRLKDAAMDELPQGLQSLDLSGCYWLTDDIIDKLPQNLKFVNLWNTVLSYGAIRKAAERFEIDEGSRINANGAPICQIM